jgi:hypothetical protein
MKGDQLRVNQVEIVDVDLESNAAQGTVWTHFFSPRVQRYDLTLAPHFGGEPLARSEPGRSDPVGQQLAAWLGAPGYGLGGMQGRSDQTSLFDRGYAFTPALDGIQGLPVQEWSTKSLLGRWRDQVEAPLEAELRELSDGVLAGKVINRTGVELQGCLLMHGQWAYELPDLPDGGEAEINDASEPRGVRTALTSLNASTPAADAGGGDAPARMAAYSEDVDQLVRAMMFYEAAGGEAYAPAPNNYQAFVDMSHLLQGDQAVLLARAGDAKGSKWMNGKTPLTSDQDRRWVYYRFVIPLE